MEEEKKTFEDLNDELLTPTPATVDEPKRNSKEWLINKIIQICEEANLELTMSNTKLRRMGKEKLQKLLGELTEEAIKTQMARSLNVNSTDDRVMAVASLRMLHDMMANGCEMTLNRVLPKYGYEMDGFTEPEAPDYFQGGGSVPRGNRGRDRGRHQNLRKGLICRSTVFPSDDLTQGSAF